MNIKKVRTTHLARIAVAGSGVLLVLLSIHLINRQRTGPEGEHPTGSVSLDVPAWSGPLSRAETALALSDSARALALSDSAWDVAVSQQDSTSNPLLFIISRRDSGLTRVHWRNAAEAESMLTRIRRIREAVLCPDHPDLAFDWHDLAMLYGRQWRHHESLAFYRRMLEIREKSLDPFHPDIGLTVMLLANHYRHLGRYAEAEPLFLRGIELRECLYLPKVNESDDAARTLTHAYDELGHVYSSQGKYAKAERAYRKSLGIRESTYGARHPEDIGASLEYLGSLYWTLGQAAEAEVYFLRSLEMREAGLGPNHADVASSLSNLAMVKTAKGEYGEAKGLYRRALDIRQRTIARDTPGGAHPGIAMCLNNLGWICTLQSKYAEAESLYTEAIAIWNRAFGYEHPRSVGTIEDLAYNFMCAGDCDAARKAYMKALEITENTLGVDHPRTADVLESLSTLSRLEGRPADAAPLAERAFGIRIANFRENALILEESEALSFSRALARSRNNLVSCLLDAGMVRSERNILADLILATKGPVSDEMFERLRSINSDADSTTHVIYQRLRDAKFLLSSLWMNQPGEDSTAQRAAIDRVERDIEDLERQVAERASSRPRQGADVSWQVISERVADGTALIEYLRWEYLDPRLEAPDARYLALVLRPGTPPDIVMLGDAAAVEDAVAQYRRHLDLITAKRRAPGDRDRQAYEDMGRSLYTLVMEPLEGRTTGCTTLLIAPDGALNLVAFPSLLEPDGSYLVESRTIFCLSSGRDLGPSTEPGSAGSGLLVMADPDLWAEESGGKAPIRQGSNPSNRMTYRSGDYGLAARGYVDSTDLSPLRGARAEAYWIADQWRETCSEPVALFVGSDATEERFKAEAPGKRMLHIATHGFVLNGGEKEGNNGARDRPTYGSNPLLMTGLFLAGTKTRAEQPAGTGADDGILTAYEVSAMDLSGVELVVLAACETGLGAIEDGEGVYGLRRAFQYAGARNVMSTLWPVRDEAMADMMASVYAPDGGSLAQRLRTAQLRMLAALRSAGEPDHPYTWASLQVTGLPD